MKNVKFEALKETVRGEKYYVLFKVLIEDREGYCIAVEDEDFSVQGLGNDFDRANEIYKAISDGVVSAIHVNDVISDMQIDFQSRIFAWNYLLLLVFMI